MNDAPPESVVDPFVAEQFKPRPSRFVPCPTCGATQWVETHIDRYGIGQGHVCTRCERGWIEVRG